MLVDSLKKFSEQTKGKLIFDYDLKKTNWFNIGGNAKAFFKPENLNDLVNFYYALKRGGVGRWGRMCCGYPPICRFSLSLTKSSQKGEM